MAWKLGDEVWGVGMMSDPDVKCKTCAGVGVLKTFSRKPKKVQCPHCEGRGKAPADTCHYAVKSFGKVTELKYIVTFSLRHDFKWKLIHIKTSHSKGYGGPPCYMLTKKQAEREAKLRNK